MHQMSHNIMWSLKKTKTKQTKKKQQQQKTQTAKPTNLVLKNIWEVGNLEMKSNWTISHFTHYRSNN